MALRQDMYSKKWVTSEKLQGQYQSLQEDMDQIVRNCPAASKREEMLLQPNCYHLLRLRKHRAKGRESCLDGNDSGQIVKFLRNEKDRKLFSYIYFIQISAIWLNIHDNNLKRMGFMYLKISCNYT